MYRRRSGILLIVADFMGCLKVGSAEYGASSMTTEIRVNRIIEWDEYEDRARLVASPSDTVWTSSERVGPEFWDGPDSNLDEVDSEAMDVAILEDAFHEKDYVAIEFNTQTRKILSVHPATIDYIAGLGKPDERTDKVPVGMLMRPTPCYLRRDHKDFDRIL